MRRLIQLLLMLLLCSLGMSAAFAQDTLTYKGTLSDADGAAQNGEFAMTVAIYGSTDADGEPVWQEYHENIDVAAGAFEIELGSITPISDALDLTGELYLGLTIGDDEELSPRMTVGAAFSTLRVEVAAQANDVFARDIHPSSVSVGDIPVVDNRGRWVGEPVDVRGDIGADGPPGPSGLRGEVGPAGPQGEAGPRGVLGPNGLNAEHLRLASDQDSDGFFDYLEVIAGTDPADADSFPVDLNSDRIPDALSGPMGAEGFQGEVGPAGDQGPEGPLGIQGETGVEGARGPQGLVGPEGPQGLRGLDGSSVDFNIDSDEDGFSDWREVMVGTDPDDPLSKPADADNNEAVDVLYGPKGAPGDVGPTGAGGPAGPEGNAGPQGAEGPMGPMPQLFGDSDNDGFADWVELLLGSDLNLIGATPADDNTDGIADQLVGVQGPNGLAGPAGPAGPDGIGANSPLTRAFVETTNYSGNAVVIPRADLGGEDVQLDVPVQGAIDSLSVSLDITHPDLTKLKVVLIAPDSTSAVLLDGPTTGDGGVDFAGVFPDNAQSVEALDVFNGRSPTGPWILRLVDKDFGNVGADRLLNSFAVSVTYQSSTAWRSTTDLYADGTEFADTSCQIAAHVDDNGAAVAGLWDVQCGSGPQVTLAQFLCGNNQLDPFEQCDDGNLVAGDDCDSRCQLEEYCGDGIVNGQEQCDDGNNNDGDGCDSVCVFEGSGPSFAGWTLCAEYLDTEGGDEVPDQWGDNCRQGAEVRVACGPSRHNFRYVQLRNVFAQGVSQYHNQGLITDSNFQIDSNSLYATGHPDVDVNTSWWAGGSGCDPTGTISINNGCPMEVECPGFAVNDPRYLWVYYR